MSDALREALVEASPTATGVSHSICECGLAESYHGEGRLRPAAEYRPRYRAASPTATGERVCPGCGHPKPDEHQEVYPGGAWCVADMNRARAAGDDPRSVGPCY